MRYVAEVLTRCADTQKSVEFRGKNKFYKNGGTAPPSFETRRGVQPSLSLLPRGAPLQLPIFSRPALKILPPHGQTLPLHCPGLTFIAFGTAGGR